MGQGGGIGSRLSEDIVVTGRSGALTPPGFITTAYAPADPPDPDHLNTFEVGTGAGVLDCGCRVTDWRDGVAPMSVERDLHACPVHDRKRRELRVAHDAEVARDVANLLDGLKGST